MLERPLTFNEVTAWWEYAMKKLCLLKISFCSKKNQPVMLLMRMRQVEGVSILVYWGNVDSYLGLDLGMILVLVTRSRLFFPDCSVTCVMPFPNYSFTSLGIGFLAALLWCLSVFDYRYWTQRSPFPECKSIDEKSSISTALLLDRFGNEMRGEMFVNLLSSPTSNKSVYCKSLPFIEYSVPSSNRNCLLEFYEIFFK